MEGENMKTILYVLADRRTRKPELVNIWLEIAHESLDDENGGLASFSEKNLGVSKPSTSTIKAVQSFLELLMEYDGVPLETLFNGMYVKLNDAVRNIKLSDEDLLFFDRFIGWHNWYWNCYHDDNTKEYDNEN